MPNFKDAFTKATDFAGSGGYKTDANVQPEVIVGQVISTVLQFLGVIFIGLMLYAGITWMMAHGNEKKVEDSKNMIIAAVIGLVIVILAYAISAFIIQNILQNKITNI